MLFHGLASFRQLILTSPLRNGFPPWFGKMCKILLQAEEKSSRSPWAGEAGVGRLEAGPRREVNSMLFSTKQPAGEFPLDPEIKSLALRGYNGGISLGTPGWRKAPGGGGKVSRGAEPGECRKDLGRDQSGGRAPRGAPPAAGGGAPGSLGSVQQPGALHHLRAW